MSKREKSIRLPIILFLIMFLVSACVVIPSLQHFSGGQRIEQPGVVFDLPTERSWSALIRSDYQVVLGANEKPNLETLIINVTSYSLPELPTPDAHLEYVKEGRKVGKLETGRFEDLYNKEEIYSGRSETCVRYESASNDHTASAVRAGGLTVLETYGMHCIHPNSPLVGVSVELSRKAPPESKSPTFKDMGEQLLQSVSFSDYKT